ncbi:Radical SAM domain protein [Magnetococcus marinus MC-1]|uniref:Radical SAM domain protein n=1 Tax=Magnetococcus marinus (strain ATCC BAA-1437 / JCM 17883 / MC-1) TaxID=156889 RepID=A0LDC2_MAGMM|nr:arsenosugar biosynthesis radical SAM (seleno)protein ArsS [Magnetococcus marinus]ABK45965.1 Radical SAM domain protein [Magnetococcus marinus MC-1]
MNLFATALQQHTGTPVMEAASLSLIQVNVGLTCNLQCRHCHVGAAPQRTEQMSWAVMQQVLALITQSGCKQVDITGGAPEMNAHIQPFIQALRARDVAVQLRTNLTLHRDPDWHAMAPWLRDHGVVLVGSMPCYVQENVDQQRGDGVYQASIAALQRLNQLGYGVAGGVPLNLVYNPGGAHLPPPQSSLEEAYKKAMWQQYGITFDQLLTLTNMPIGRFRADLRREGQEQAYWGLLQASFNPATVAGLMCRHQVSVRWDGVLFDCDFNLALDLPARVSGGARLGEVTVATLRSRRVVIEQHCLGCTAGCGSSCGGALV